MAEAESVDLTVVRAGFVPERLRMARELQRMSQRDVAEGIVTSAAVSQYERGLVIPRSDVLVQLAGRLGVSPEFFTVEDTGFDTPAFFRSLRSAPASERKRARHNVQLVHQIARVLEEHVKLPPLDVPKHPVDVHADASPPEAAAAQVRREWGLPPGPVDNVVRCAERHGIIVARLASGHAKIDAFSVPFYDRPVIMMSAAKGKKDRSRLDVAHELGHLVMHTPGQRATKTAEQQAQQFAAAFLMPADDIRSELPSRPDWEKLAMLKQRWETAMAALLYRAKELEVMDPGVYVQAMKTMSARGWRRHEPIALDEPESPMMLAKATELADISESGLARRIAVPVELLRDIIDLASDDRPALII